MPYAPLLSAKAIEKLTRDHGYQPREPKQGETISPARVLGREVERLRSNEDFPYFAHLHRNWTKRQALCEAQNHRCAYCGIATTVGGCNWAHDYPTIDHVVPRAARGHAIWSNEVMACWLCNQGRGAMRAEFYFAKVKEIGRTAAYRWGLDRARRASLLRPPVLVDY